MDVMGERFMVKENKTFIQTTLLYFIPFVMMAVVAIAFLERTFSMLEANITSVSQAQMQGIVEELEDGISESAQIANEIYLDRALTSEQIQNYDGATISGISQLYDYQKRMTFNPIVFVTYWDDRVVSSIGTSTLDSLMKLTLKLNERGEAEFAQVMQGTDLQNIGLLECENGNRYMMVVYHYPSGFQTEEKWIGFLFNGERIGERIESALRSVDSVALLNYQGQMLTQVVSPSVNCEPDEIDAQLDQLRAGIKGTSRQGYAILDGTALRLNLTLRVAINNSELKSELFAEEIKMLIIGALVFVGVALLLWFISRRNYEPIESIKQMAMNNMPEMQREKNENDFDFIRKALEQNFAEQKRQNELFRHFQRETRKQMGWLLLNGATPEELQQPEMIEYFGLQADAPYYAAVGLQLVSDEPTRSITARISEIPGVLTCYTVKHNLITVLVALQTRDTDQRERTALVNRIQEEMRSSGCTCKVAACGMAYEQLSEVHQSQKEMQSALTAACDSLKPIRFFEDLAHVSNQMPHRTSELLLQFRADLRRGSVESARKTLAELLHQREAGNEELRFARYVIVQTVMEIMQDAANVPKQENLLNLIMLDNIVFEEEIGRVMTEMFRVNEESDRTLDGDAVIAYIKANFTSPELSQDLVAANFHCSTKSIARVIKKKKECSYQDFLTSLRMQRACELLMTDLDTQKIVERIGYYDLSSFNRRFKATFGVTPREWRIQHRKQSV